jgi:hypothetical protein
MGSSPHSSTYPPASSLYRMQRYHPGSQGMIVWVTVALMSGSAFITRPSHPWLSPWPCVRRTWPSAKDGQVWPQRPWPQRPSRGSHFPSQCRGYGPGPLPTSSVLGAFCAIKSVLVIHQPIKDIDARWGDQLRRIYPACTGDPSDWGLRSH